MKYEKHNSRRSEKKQQERIRMYESKVKGIAAGRRRNGGSDRGRKQVER